MALAQFFTYILRKQDGTPFYVGKGRLSRIVSHLKAARRGSMRPAHKIIRLITRRKEWVGVDIFPAKDEVSAYAEEIRLIAVFGVRPDGPLVNGTIGGGAKHTRYTPAVKKRLSKAAKAQWRDPIKRAKTIIGIRRACKSPAYRKKISERLRGFKHTASSRKKNSDSKKKLFKKFGRPEGFVWGKGSKHSLKSKAKIAATLKSRVAAGTMPGLFKKGVLNGIWKNKSPLQRSNIRKAIWAKIPKAERQRRAAKAWATRRAAA